MISGICEDDKTHSSLGSGVWVQKTMTAGVWLTRLSSAAGPPQPSPTFPGAKPSTAAPTRQTTGAHCNGLGFNPGSQVISFQSLFLHLSSRDKVITNDIIRRRNSLAQSRPLINVSCLLDQKYWISREAGSSTVSTVPGWECVPGTCPHPPSSLRDTQLLSPVTTPTTGGPAQASGPGNSLHPRRRAPSCPRAKNSQQTCSAPRVLKKREAVLPGQRPMCRSAGTPRGLHLPFPNRAEEPVGWKEGKREDGT